jgi:hypothetical protein
VTGSLSADVNAPAAKDAAKRIVGKQAEIDFLVDDPFQALQGLGLQADIQVLGNADELATAPYRASLWLAVVRGHEQLERRPLETPHRRRGGRHHQTVADSLRARGYRPVDAFDLHEAQSARRVRVLPRLHEAQVGDEDTVFQAGLENAFSFFRPDLFGIDQNRYHSHWSPYGFRPSPAARLAGC